MGLSSSVSRAVATPFKRTTQPPRIILQPPTAMKTLVCLVLCALVATTYAAPASFSDQAQLEGFFSNLVKIIKKVAPLAKKAYDGDAAMQDDSKYDNNHAKVAALIHLLNNEAAVEGFGSFLKKVFKVGRKTAPYVTKGLQFWNDLNGGVARQNDPDDDKDYLANIEAVLSSVQDADNDDEDSAQVNALLQSLQLENKADIESFWGTLGKAALHLLGKKK